MPNWKEILDEIQSSGSTFDILRRKYLRNLFELTGRNVIIYYSGWLQKSQLSRQFPMDFGIEDADKNGFMTCIHKLDRDKGLDLVLHTPGGATAATESIVDYLRSMFKTDIRVIVPQIAMSGGTMIACAAKEILMGTHSSLGPIDPQIAGLPAHGIVDEFERAKMEISKTPAAIPVWQPIIAKYSPALIGECEKAIEWSSEIVKEWLISGMFLGDADAQKKADRVITELGSHSLTKSHSRHISIKAGNAIGLNIYDLASNDALQDAILSVHHITIQTLASTAAYKIVENHDGVAFIQTIQTIVQQ